LLPAPVPMVPLRFGNSAHGRPNKSEIAKVTVVSRKSVEKIEAELLMECGRFVDSRDIEKYYAVGPGAKTMDSLDAWVCLQLYL
jgi:hypothetical protein